MRYYSATATLRIYSFSPDQVDLKYLTEEGRLNVPTADQKAIDELVRRGIKENQFSGRIRKEDIRKITGKRSNYSAEFILDEESKQLYVSYIFGKKIIAQGTFGKIKAMLDRSIEVKNPWQALKVQASTAMTANEFKMAKKHKLALAHLFRGSVKYEGRWQEEIIMPWFPGETLQEMITNNKKLAPLHVMKILVNMCREVVFLHKAGSVHRDISAKNFMVFGTRVKLIDLSFAVEKENFEFDHVIGTPGHLHRKIITQKQYDEITDIYALAITMADFLSLIANESLEYSQRKEFEGYKGAIKFAVQAGLQLTSAYAEQFRKNDILPQDILSDVLGFLREMMTDQVNTAEECVEFFKAKYNEMHAMPDLKITTGIINVSDYLAGTSAMKKQFLQKAQAFASTQFIWTDQRPSPRAYIGLWREMKKGQYTKLREKDLELKDIAHWKESFPDSKKQTYEFITVEKPAPSRFFQLAQTVGQYVAKWGCCRRKKV